MSVNLKCLLFSVIIVIFTVIYASSNGFYSSDQEFFPIVYAQSLPLPLPTLSSEKVELQQQQDEEIDATGFWSGSTSIIRYHSNGFFYTAENSFSGPIKHVKVDDFTGRFAWKAAGPWTVSCNILSRSGGIEQPYTFTGTVDPSRISIDPDTAHLLGFALLTGTPIPCGIETSLSDKKPETTVDPDGTIRSTLSYSLTPTPGCENIAVGCRIETTNVNYIIHPVDNPPIEVEVNPSEINPYPINIDPPEPKSQIKIITKQSDGMPAPFTDVTVETCSVLGTKDGDGHVHDQITDNTCHQSQRPKATLSDGTNTGNPLSLTTDSDGIITLDYTPPTSEIDGKKYYISGKDKIVASLKNNPNVKNDAETITTKVPDLIQMPNSDNCIGNELYYYFESQTNHDCIFYGTENTNNELIKLAEGFNKRQIDCSNASKPKDEPACDVTTEGSQKNDFVTINANNIIPLKITAMSLPWGGLLDKNGDWSIPYFNHNDGKNVDVGFNIKGKEMTIDQKKLLRDEILDSGHLLPYAGEGKEDDVTLAKDHFHIEFVDCSSDSPSNSLSAMQSSTPICDKELEGVIEVNLQDRGIVPLKNLKVEVCEQTGLLCNTVYTDENGKYKTVLPDEKVNIKVHLKDKNEIFEVVEGKPVSDPAYIELKDMEFKKAKNLGDILISAYNPFIKLNNKEITSISSNILQIQNFAHLAGLYYYTNIGVEFGKKFFIIDSSLPLEIVGFSPIISEEEEVSWHRAPHHISISTKLSKIAANSSFDFLKPCYLECIIDAFFHEFGHFLVYEANKGAERFLQQNVHPNLKGIITADELNCHWGYAQLDSSCAFDEGLAHFISAAISDSMFVDKGHKKLQRNAVIFDNVGITYDLEKEITNPVGFKLAKFPFFHYQYKKSYEEFNVASLLWDLYDSGKNGDKEAITLHLNSILAAATNSITMVDLYNNLKGFFMTELDLKKLYADFHLCLKTSSSTCTPEDVNQGYTSWAAIGTFKKAPDLVPNFGYPYPGYPHPIGRP